MLITKQKAVTIDYTLTDEKGTVIDSSKNGQALTYLHGSGNIIPGLESALEGKAKGDSLKVTIPPEQAYGHSNPEMIQSVPRDRFPADAKIVPGMQFQAQPPQGGPRVVTVVSVDAESVRIDANHPLAGMTLSFDVTIVEVRDATAEEMDHGHVHGPDGHHHH